jgi:7-carboxy-7-deazaguanine synthase
MSIELILAQLDDNPEVFYSIQGEGISTGVPSIFVRCSGCNLQCYWCDTQYTWNWQGTPYQHANDTPERFAKVDRAASQVRIQSGRLAELISALNCRQIIFTGGEPLLQQSGLAEVAGLLRKSSTEYSFEVETNGTVLPEADLDRFIAGYNVSLKLSNSGLPAAQRFRAEVIEWFAKSPRASFKFVVSQERDADEIQHLADRYLIAKQRIIVMPEASTQSELRSKRPALFQLCLARGWRFSDRLHVEIFGSLRGV